MLDLPAPLIGFTRSASAERLVIVFNPSDRAQRLSLKGFAGLAPLEDHGLAMLVEGDVALLPPYGMLLGELEAAGAVGSDRLRVVAG